MMAITNSLARRGLLEREASAIDRRRQILRLTSTGAEALCIARDAVAAHEAWLKAQIRP